MSPLAEAAYEPAAPTLVLQSPTLAAYVERAAGQGAPLRFLLKASDYLEDVPIGAVNLSSGNHGNSRNLARRPSLTVRWRAAAERASWRARSSSSTGGAWRSRASRPPGRRASPSPSRPRAASIRRATRRSSGGGAPPAAKSRGPGGGSARRPGDWIDVRLTAACDPVLLGDPFEAELRDTWIRTVAPEQREVPWAFVSPVGVVHRVAARYEGGYRWSVRFVPDEAGRWRYTWKQHFAKDPYTSAPGVFDVFVPPERVEAATEALLRDLEARDPRRTRSCGPSSPRASRGSSGPRWTRSRGRSSGTGEEPRCDAARRGPGNARRAGSRSDPTRAGRPPAWKRGARHGSRLGAMRRMCDPMTALGFGIKGGENRIPHMSQANPPELPRNACISSSPRPSIAPLPAAPLIAK